MEPLISVQNLVVEFPIFGGIFQRQIAAVHAVSDVSLEIKKGETLGLVGESGCGKSTLGRALLQLIPSKSGNVFYKGKNITGMSRGAMRPYRKNLQIIFQDPFSSLNPRMNVEEIIGEPLDLHSDLKSNRDRRTKILSLMDLCGLRKESIDRYPHEFSGGQRQRIAIARALAVNPEFIVCDEPVSALDVSIQAQIINLMMDLQKDLGLTYLFISHDLKVVEHISTRVAVMYLGKIVEITSAEEIYKNPRHPYTQALLSAVPLIQPIKDRKRILLKGDVPSPINPPKGCHFHPRCQIARPNCSTSTPALESKSLHAVSCFYPQQLPT
jgi:oligopeptide transport system ATP-binding protein